MLPVYYNCNYYCYLSNNCSASLICYWYTDRNIEWCISKKDSPALKYEHAQEQTQLGVMRRYSLRWHRHVERKGDADCVMACTGLEVEGKAAVGRPRKTWQNSMSSDVRLLKVDHLDVHNQKKWSAVNAMAEGKPSSIWNTIFKRREEEALMVPCLIYYVNDI